MSNIKIKVEKIFTRRGNDDPIGKSTFKDINWEDQCIITKENLSSIKMPTENIDKGQGIYINKNENSNMIPGYTNPPFSRKYNKYTYNRFLQCKECELKFVRVSEFKHHLTTHFNKKVHKCEECTKSFAYSSHLQRHLEIHTGERKFECEICLRKFRRNINLILHMRTHTEAKTYKCEICQKNFTMYCSFKNHIKLHTGQKPYKCTHCDMSFSLSSQLQLHADSHTEVKTYKCEDCDMKFPKMCSLKKHQLTSIHLCAIKKKIEMTGNNASLQFIRKQLKPNLRT